MASTPDDLAVAEQIDEVCDRFERDLRGGNVPRIENLLTEVSDSQRPALLRALLALELELLAKAGRTPDPQQYHERFPDHAGLVDEAYASIRQAAPTSGKPTSPKTSESVRGSMASVDTSQGGRQRATSSLEAFKKLGRFEIRQELGRGAFGTVYRAYDPQLDREVAIKVPQEKSLTSDDDRRRFLREARSAASLQHPNICPVHEIGTIDGRDYIVMAFIDGKPLSKVLESGATLSERQVASAIRKIALALQEAHEKGIIHRDLKSANIMINRKGEPVVMDFGLARRDTPTEAQISVSGQIMGSPAYMSPEQARGESKSVGPQADVYSLGILMYEMLCGRRPFLGNVTEVLGMILHVEPDPPSKHRPGIDANVEAVCLRAIAKDPKQRFASMTQFAAALSNCLKKTSASPSDSTETQSAAQLATKESLVAETDHAQIGETQRLARIVEAVSAEVESKVKRVTRKAIKQAAKRHAPKWWHYAIGSAAMGLILLCGILFFVRRDNVTVVINIPIDIKDPSLSFLLDDKPLAADALAVPIDLKPGEHELVVNKDDKLFKKFRFNVGKGQTDPVVVQDVTPTPPIIAKVGEKDEAGFVPLFNGKDLTGWKTHPSQGGDWKVQDGFLTGSGPTSHLFTERGDFKDFHTRAEFHVNAGGNSGLFFRTEFGLTRVPGKYPHGYEAQILHRDPPLPGNTTGTLTKFNQGKDTVIKPSEWVTMEVIAQGNHILIKVNGTTTVDFVDQTNSYTSGHFALQLMEEGSVVQFRKIEVKELRPVPVTNTPAADPVPEDAARAAAKWLLENSSMLDVEAGGQKFNVRSANMLPPEEFRIVGLEGSKNPALTDEVLTKLAAGLTHLQQLGGNSLKFTGTGFAAWKGHQHLRIVSCGGANGSAITDTGLEQIAGLTSLQELNVTSDQVTDAGIAHLSKLPKLTTLELTRAKLTDAGVAQLQKCPKLVSFRFYQTTLGDGALESLGKMPLDALVFLAPNVTDAGVAHLSQCRSLKLLNLGTTQITDAGLEHLHGLTNLGTLKLGKTKVTAAGVERLRKVLPSCQVTY